MYAQKEGRINISAAMKRLQCMAFYKGVYGSITISIAENIWFHYVMNRDIKYILFEEFLTWWHDSK